MTTSPVKMLAVAVFVVVVMICSSAATPTDPNDVMREALNQANQGVGGSIVPKGLDFKVKDWQGVSSSQSFPGGSVSGSSYTGKLGNSGTLTSRSEILFVALSSMLTFLMAKL